MTTTDSVPIVTACLAALSFVMVHEVLLHFLKNESCCNVIVAILAGLSTFIRFQQIDRDYECESSID